MIVTSVRIVVADQGQLCAYASIVFDGQLAINGLRLIEKPNGDYFVSFPSRKLHNQQHAEYIHPTSRELRQHVTAEVIKEYQREKQKLLKEAQPG